MRARDETRFITERRRNLELMRSAKALLEKKLIEVDYARWVEATNAKIKQINNRIRESA